MAEVGAEVGVDAGMYIVSYLKRIEWNGEDFKKRKNENKSKMENENKYLIVY